MTWAAVAIGGGMALSAGAGAMSSAAGNRGARQARDWYGNRTSEGYQRLINTLYGGGNPIDWSVPGGRPPTPTSGSLLGRQQGIADLYAQRAGGIGIAFDQGAAGLSNLYGQSEGLAAQFGAGGEKLIDEEMARQLKAANQMSGARLAASGFGNSTAGANQMSQNALEAARSGAQQKLGLRGAALDRRLAVRGQRGAAEQQNLGRRADLYGNLLNNEMGFRQQPIQTELMAGMSSVANPWLNQNTSQYYPGYSPGGTALGNTGNAMGMYGGMLYGQGQGGGGDSAYSMSGGLGNSYNQWNPGVNRPH